jgi:hypothetical protein
VFENKTFRTVLGQQDDGESCIKESFIVFTAPIVGDHIKEDKMDYACSTHGGAEKFIYFR